LKNARGAWKTVADHKKTVAQAEKSFFKLKNGCEALRNDFSS
jgi:hypothetical protein